MATLESRTVPIHVEGPELPIPLVYRPAPPRPTRGPATRPTRACSLLDERALYKEEPSRALSNTHEPVIPRGIVQPAGDTEPVSLEARVQPEGSSMAQTTSEAGALTVRLKLKDADLGKWTLEDESLIIGRNEDCDIVIENLSVSRQHAILERSGDSWMIRDLGSLNGVAVNGKRTNQAVLKPGDVITIGKHHIEIRAEGRRDFGPAAESAYEETIERSVDNLAGSIENPGRLVEMKGSSYRSIVLDHPLIVLGKGDEADIRIHGSMIADYHAEIYYRDGGYVVRHVEGRGKIRINGKTTRESRLIEGDEIEIGRVKFKFQARMPARNRG